MLVRACFRDPFAQDLCVQYAVLLMTLHEQLLCFGMTTDAVRLERAIDSQRPWNNQFWVS